MITYGQATMPTPEEQVNEHYRSLLVSAATKYGTVYGTAILILIGLEVYDRVKERRKRK